MGFCRRCGDIVSGARCKCGGAAVAPAVPWNHESHADSTHDRWSKTYVQRAKSLSSSRSSPAPQSTDSTAPVTHVSSPRRFPRPISHIGSPVKLDNRVSAHIASSTSSTSQRQRPPSPLKYVTHVPAPEADILPSLSDATLSKVYGSVLQPKESLTTHSCAVCSTPFPPDATIYPDPASTSSSRFLCRPCYETNGGTKGKCPTCSRPVLTLKSEGQFIHVANQFWHKRCFNCSGCFKYIGDTPMVDLLGRPSCTDCFESCLKRDSSTPKKFTSTSTSNSPRLENSGNLGGMSLASKAAGQRTREDSPAMEELEQRLGISGRRAGSPSVEDLNRRLAHLTKSSPTSLNSSPTTRKALLTREDSSDNQLTMSTSSRARNVASPTSNLYTGSTEPENGASPSPIKTVPAPGSPARTTEAMKKMKQRFMKSSSSSPRETPSPDVQSIPTSRLIYPSTPKRSSLTDHFRFDPQLVSPSSPVPPQTPDLMSDFSDTMTQSSLGPDSPPKLDGEDVFSSQETYMSGYGSSFSQSDFFDASGDVIAEETASQMATPTHTPNSIQSRTTPLKHSQSMSSFVSPSTCRSAKVPFPDVSDNSLSDLSMSICAGCGRGLFSIRGGGKFVTVPGDGELSVTYHVECFRCAVCDGVFNEVSGKKAAFVKANGGACHIECVTPPRITTIQKIPTAVHPDLTPAIPLSPLKPAVGSKPYATQPTSSRLERPSLTTSPASSIASFPRFGTKTICPGCRRSVFPMEQGVVPGPQNTRWHASCLVCGGKKETAKGIMIRRVREDNTEPGCGKRLDSAARTDVDGGVWCRECLLLLGMGGSPQASPTRSPLPPMLTGTSKLIPQSTGTTTIARQFTGLGSDPGLLRQLTGGGLSPTRSISPTKQPSIRRTRPKSMIGMRKTKSIDEGRGMFLVKQLTGAD